MSGIGAQRLLPRLDRVGQPVAVPLCREVAAELVDEQAAVREDQHAEMPCGLDEPGGGDRLPGRRGVTEAVAARRAGILPLEADLLGLLRLVGEVDVLLVLVLLDELRDTAVRGAVAVLLRAPLGRSDQLGQHPRQRVDLVAAQGSAGGGRRRLGGEHALETEHEAVAHLPARRRRSMPRFDLLERVVQREPPRGARRERDLGILAGMEERLGEPPLGAMGGALEVRKLSGRRGLSDSGFLHVRSSLETRRSVLRNRSRKAAHSGIVRAPASLHP